MVFTLSEVNLTLNNALADAFLETMDAMTAFGSLNMSSETNMSQSFFRFGDTWHAEVPSNSNTHGLLQGGTFWLGVAHSA